MADAKNIACMLARVRCIFHGNSVSSTFRPIYLPSCPLGYVLLQFRDSQPPSRTCAPTLFSCMYACARICSTVAINFEFTYTILPHISVSCFPSRVSPRKRHRHAIFRCFTGAFKQLRGFSGDLPFYHSRNMFLPIETRSHMESANVSGNVQHYSIENVQ